MASEPTVLKLHERLFSVNATEREPSVDRPLTQEEMRDAIVSHDLSWAVCDSAHVPGFAAVKTLSFGQYYTVLFGETLDGKAWVKGKKGRAA